MAELLPALANADFSSLHLMRANGTRPLDVLRSLCGSPAGEAVGPAGYWAILDGALEFGFAVWITDYVAEVRHWQDSLSMQRGL